MRDCNFLEGLALFKRQKLVGSSSVGFPQKSYNLHLDVSENSGTPKWMVYNGNPLLKWMIWGHHYFRKHPQKVYIYRLYKHTQVHSTGNIGCFMD